jgi:hypothetical protein
VVITEVAAEIIGVGADIIRNGVDLTGVRIITTKVEGLHRWSKHPTPTRAGKIEWLF